MTVFYHLTMNGGRGDDPHTDLDVDLYGEAPTVKAAHAAIAEKLPSLGLTPVERLRAALGSAVQSWDDTALAAAAENLGLK